MNALIIAARILDKVATKWKTINGSHVLVDKDGNVIAGANGKLNKKSGKKKSLREKYSSGMIKPSPRGSNKLLHRGFRNKQKNNNHISKHLKEFPEYTEEQYVQRAIELMESPVSKNVLGHIDKDDIIIRYDKSKNEFVKGSIEKGIFTFMRPKEKSVYYFNQRREDIKHGGSV